MVDSPSLSPARALTPIQAMWRGVVTALVVALPVAVLNQWLVSTGDIDRDSPMVLVFWLLILFGAAAGGWGVLRLCPQAALAHAAAAGTIAYVVVQTIGIVTRTIRGEDLSWVAFPLLALMMATAGMLGGMFGRRWNRTGAENLRE
jgi:putative membrane protein (TIGR04086 family)